MVSYSRIAAVVAVATLLPNHVGAQTYTDCNPLQTSMYRLHDLYGRNIVANNLVQHVRQIQRLA